MGKIIQLGAKREEDKGRELPKGRFRGNRRRQEKRHVNLRWLASFIQQTFIRDCICAWQGLDTEHRDKQGSSPSLEVSPGMCSCVGGGEDS